MAIKKSLWQCFYQEHCYENLLQKQQQQ